MKTFVEINVHPLLLLCKISYSVKKMQKNLLKKCVNNQNNKKSLRIGPGCEA